MPNLILRPWDDQSSPASRRVAVAREADVARRDQGWRPFRRAMVAWFLALVGLGLMAGCQSTGQPGSASFASVTIPGKTADQIRAATMSVFRADGYEVFTSDETMIFEKEGTRSDTLAYGGLVAAHNGAVTLVRVTVQLVDLGNGSRRLQCHAFKVTGAGDSFAEEEHRLANFRSGPYQRLLNEVARQLREP